MEISPIQRKTKASDVPLQQLVANKQIPEEEKVAEISRQFEAVLIRQILAEGQKPEFGADKTQSTSSAGIYRDMVTNQMADRISHSGGIGLANALKHQLSRQTLHTMSPSASAPTDSKGGN
jgi:peptidoglycan hydrolase FlgJ